MKQAIHWRWWAVRLVLAVFLLILAGGMRASPSELGGFFYPAELVEIFPDARPLSPRQEARLRQVLAYMQESGFGQFEQAAQHLQQYQQGDFHQLSGLYQGVSRFDLFTSYSPKVDYIASSWVQARVVDAAGLRYEWAGLFLHPEAFKVEIPLTAFLIAKELSHPEIIASIPRLERIYTYFDEPPPSPETAIQYLSTGVLGAYLVDGGAFAAVMPAYVQVLRYQEIRHTRSQEVLNWMQLYWSEPGVRRFFDEVGNPLQPPGDIAATYPYVCITRQVLRLPDTFRCDAE